MKKIKEEWDIAKGFPDEYGVYFVDCFNAWDSLDLEKTHIAISDFAEFHLAWKAGTHKELL